MSPPLEGPKLTGSGPEGPLHPAPGERIGHFRIARRLGAGGAGAVFLAEDVDIPGRKVALKLVRPDGLTPDLEALRREASALAALQHPHILVAHEIGASPFGPYLATEFMAGGSLAERQARSPLPADAALRVGRAVADALRAAHEKGILHRDIKPANLLATEDGTVKVGDFGLAWRRAPAASDGDISTTTTRTDANPGAPTSAGTPPYLAPEILEGGPPTAASDQFAFGVTLHELLTGRRPFAGPHWSQLVLAGRPSIGDEVPGDLARVLRRCLARNPTDRYSDMGAVVAGLDAALDRRDPRRRRLGYVTGGALALLGLMVAGYAVIRHRSLTRARAHNEDGRRAYERGDRDAARRAFLAAHSVDPGYLPACANLGMLAARESNPTWAVTILEECAATFPRSDAARYNLGTTLRLTGRHEKAEKELRQALTLAGTGALRTLVLNELALLLLDATRPRDALALLEGSGAFPDETVDGAILHKTAGLAYLAAGHADKAAAALRRALAGPLPIPHRGPALVALGRSLEKLQDVSGAVEAYSQALLAGTDPDIEDAARTGLTRAQQVGSAEAPR